MVRGKTWVVLFLSILLAGIGAFMALNYHANPLGYFTTNKGLDYNWTDDYGRSIKAKYILAHPEEYQGFILGGSKAGAISTELMQEYTGLPYYNLYYNIGNMADYLRYTQFLIDNTQVKEITLHLSSYETLQYERTSQGSAYKVPAALKSDLAASALEYLSFLMTDVKTTVETLSSRPKKNPQNADSLVTGMKNWRTYLRSFAKDSEAYIAKNVTKKQERALRSLFKDNTNDTDEKKQEARTKGVQAMREIKALCDENGVTLRVIIGASFLDEKYTYECTQYYSYLRELVEICGEVWDFSDYCDVNMNPYNFFNEKHFTYATSDLMIRTVFGAEKKEGFGTLLTKDNIYSYLLQRQADYRRLQEEYEASGTVALQGINDESYIPLEPYLNVS